MRRAAVFRLAVWSKITGLLPPSSRVTGVRVFAAAAITTLPTAWEPVKKMWSKGCSSSASVSALPPWTTAACSRGRARVSTRSTTPAVAGAYSEGLTTAQHPADSAPIKGMRHRWKG